MLDKKERLDRRVFLGRVRCFAVMASLEEGFASFTESRGKAHPVRIAHCYDPQFGFCRVGTEDEAYAGVAQGV